MEWRSAHGPTGSQKIMNGDESNSEDQERQSQQYARDAELMWEKLLEARPGITPSFLEFSDADWADEKVSKVLFAYLSSEDISEKLKIGIARMLSQVHPNDGQRIASKLLGMFVLDTTPPGLRSQIGMTIESLALPKRKPGVSLELKDAILDQSLGDARIWLVHTYARAERENAVSTLLAVIDQGKMRIETTSALGDTKSPEVRDTLIELSNYPDSDVRNKAKAALKKINRVIEKKKK